jgi:hypothetical protein
MATIAKGAKTAATEVHLPIDADPELSAAYQAVKDLGYKVTWGTDIGHFFTDPVIDPAVISGHQSMLRKFVGAMGLSVDHFPTTTPGMYAQQTADRGPAAAVRLGPAQDGAGETPAMLLARVSNTTRTPDDGRSGSRSALRRTSSTAPRGHDGRAGGGGEPGARLRADAAGHRQPRRHLQPVPQAVHPRCRTPPELADFYKAMGLADDQPMYTAADAALIYRTVLNAQAKRPASMMGLSKLEDVFRAAPSLAMSKLQMDRVQVPGVAQVLRGRRCCPTT